MKLKIISDGTVQGTRVINADTGELVEHAVALTWSINASAGQAQATLTLASVEVDIEADIPVESV